MNVRKRGLALLMCICMIFTLLPFSALAESAGNENGEADTGEPAGAEKGDIVYGSYDTNGDNWTPNYELTATNAVKQYPAQGETSATGANITYSKTAAKAEGDNTYDITLNVTSTAKKTAVALVIDASYASQYCAECGKAPSEGHKEYCGFKGSDGYDESTITPDQSFLKAEKDAAKAFIDNYAGSVSGTGRYVQIVSYQGTAAAHGTWVDVSTPEGKEAAIAAIDDVFYILTADTADKKNLEQGLYKAYECFADNVIKNTDKYAIVMTNSWPNAYGEDNKYDDWILPSTSETADLLRDDYNCTVFTVAEANNESYKRDKSKESLCDLLKAIASEGCAYEGSRANVSGNVSWLNNTLAKDIIGKLNLTTGFTVTDPMGKYMELLKNTLIDCRFDNNTIVWTPSTGTATDNNDGSVTVSYTLMYKVKVNTNGDGFEYDKWYATNGDTLLKIDGEDDTLQFNVPGVKAAVYDVTYKYVDEDFNVINDSALKAPVDPKSYAVGAEFSVVAAPAETDIPGYDFVDWYLDEDTAVKTGEVLNMVKGGMTIYGKLTRSETIYIVNYIWNGEYIADSNTFDCKVGDVIKYGGVATDNSVKPVEIEGYTAKPVALSELKISETATQNVINFYYYKNVEITAKSDSVVYDGKEHSVSGFTGAPKDADFSAITVGAKGTKVNVYPAEFAANTVGTVDQTDNYIITKATKGQLEITSRPYRPNPSITDKITVEITGNSDSVVYDGTEHSVKDYTVKISDSRYTEKDFTFSGKALASGINAGAYEMGLKADQFKNTNARFTNVKFVIKADGVLTITPKDLTITAGSKTEYGPTPVTCGDWTVSGLAAGDKVESVKITGIQSVPGSSPNVPSDAVIKNAKGEDVTKNYAIKYVNGTLTMLEVLNKEDHFNYIIGTPEGLSLPTANVTRAEVATIFFRLMTDDARAKFDSLDNNFSDVAKGQWYNRAISTLANAGIIKGDPAGTYRPGDPITRAEMATIIARFGDFKEGGKTFSDISGHWAQKYIELAASNGWINGNPDGTFKPNNNITRAETVAMINRVLDRQTKDVSDLLPVSQMTNWSDNMDTAKWYYRDMQEATNNHKAERVGNSEYEKWTEKLPDIDWASYQI